jgi:hypothetical protein
MMANWISSRYDFENGHWTDIADIFVPELNMKIGSAISALRKSWAPIIKSREELVGPMKFTNLNALTLSKDHSVWSPQILGISVSEA